MTVEERISYCKICENRKMNMQIGLLCGLTNEKPTFEGSCESFAGDQKEIEYQLKRKEEASGQEYEGAFAMEKKGLDAGALGGIVMMLIAAVWFFVGLAADRIFFYPPILFLIGAYGVFKGLFSGNYAGKR